MPDKGEEKARTRITRHHHGAGITALEEEFARGDFDLDGTVGGADLAVLLSIWGVINPPLGDLNGDGIIGGADLSIFLGNWGAY